MFNFLRKPEFRLIETREVHLGGNIETNYQIEFKTEFFGRFRPYEYLYSKDIDKQYVFNKPDGITLFNSSPIVCLRPYFKDYTTTVQHSKDELEVVKFIMEVLQIIQSNKKIIDEYSFQTFSPLVMFVENNCHDDSDTSGEIYLINQLDKEVYNDFICYRCFCLNNIRKKEEVIEYLNKKLITSVKTEKYYL